MKRDTKPMLRFTKETDSVHKVIDRRGLHIANIKRIYKGGFMYYVCNPVPCIDNGVLYYNLNYTKKQLMEMAVFISKLYKEMFKRKKDERNNDN